MSNEPFFSHDQALVETTKVGNGTRIWAFAHVLEGADIGEDCNICDHVFIENHVKIGDRVTIKCGVQVWDGITLSDDVFIGPNVTFTNDKWPRSREWLENHPETTVGEGASIGANATILPGITIGRGAMIGAGSVVTKSVPAFAVVTGNPGRIVRYSSASPTVDANMTSKAKSKKSDFAELITGVSFDEIPMVRDLRGNLTVRQVENGLPFVPQRYFVICDVPSKEVRGEHAHKECHQLLVCLKGSVHCLADDGENRTEYVLDSPEKSLHLPPMIWGTQYKYSPDAILMVLASLPYDPDDYIRSYEEFVEMKTNG